jgi:PleD family two-component response regulator
MVDLMGGRIGCSSDLGIGSTFYFTAPFGLRLKRRSLASVRIELPSEIKTVRAAAPLSEKRMATRMLIVEDCEDNPLLVQAYLNGHGFDLHFAENGKIAVEKVIRGVFDITLC